MGGRGARVGVVARVTGLAEAVAGGAVDGLEPDHRTDEGRTDEGRAPVIAATTRDLRDRGTGVHAPRRDPRGLCPRTRSPRASARRAGAPGRHRRGAAIDRTQPGRPEAGEVPFAGALARVGPRAGAFIVTLYGDVVEPRGGRLAMADIVETCAAVGISETLARTAVSRLVAAGQLAGERRGRRSFYGLTEAAGLEYAAAARVLFEGGGDRGWRLVWVGPDRAEEVASGLARAGYARIGPYWYFGPSGGAGEVRGEGAAGRAAFACGPASPGADLRALAAAHWDLPGIAERYGDFAAAFGPVAAALPGAALSDARALHLRLLALHAYRLAVQADARLPADALPEGWIGARARTLFADLYLCLASAADRHVARRFESGDGRLPERTPATERRLSVLREVGRA